MSTIAAICGAVATLGGLITLIIKAFTKSPQDKQKEIDQEIGNAFKNVEKGDPADLSKLINK